MLRAGRTPYFIIIVEPADRFAAMVIFVKSPMVGDIASDAPTVVITGLAIVRTVWAELPHYSLIAQLGQTHTQTQVVSTEVIVLSTTHAVGKIHASKALG